MKKAVTAVIAVIFILALALAVGLICVSADEPELPETSWVDYAVKPHITDDGITYEITTAEELAWISKTVAYQSSSFIGKKIKLMNDLDLSAHLWMPIGTGSYHFKGEFDGNNKTIDGLTVSGSYTYAGLIGDCDSGYIHDVNMANAYVNVIKGDSLSFAGSITGYTENDIVGCTVSDCIVSSSSTRPSNAGGIAGKGSAINCTATNCSVSSSKAGGITGEGSATNCTVINCTVSDSSSSSSSNKYAGGITGEGFATDCTAIDCTVSSSIGSFSYAGGITGNGSATSCIASDCTVSSHSDSFSYAGGISGSGSATNCTARDCTVSSFSSDSFSCAGGISGSGSATNCTAINCTISSFSSSSYNFSNAGGIAGYGSATNCIARDCTVYSTTSDSSSYAGGITGSGHVKNCVVINNTVIINSKSIDSIGYAGGIAGKASVIKSCYCDAEVKKSDNCIGTVYLGAFVGKQTDFIHGYYNSEKAVGLNIAGEPNGSIIIVQAITADELKSQELADNLNAYWLDTEDTSDDVNAVWAIDTDVESPTYGYPIPYGPLVTGMEITPPTFVGGNAVVKIIGTNFDFAQKLEVQSNSVKYAVNLDTLTIEIPTLSNWNSNTEGYYTNYSYYVYLNGIEVNYTSGTFKLPYDSTEAAITSLTYPTTVAGDGSAVEITINGTNLVETSKTIALYVNKNNNTIYADVKKVGDKVTAMLVLPRNITESNQVYTIKVRLDGSNVNFSSQQTLTVMPDTEYNHLDLNHDGNVDILDVIYLMNKVSDT